MNRFVIGGILAAVVVLLTGSLNRLLGDRSQSPESTGLQASNTEAPSDMGSLPVEQAGQLVRRQSDVGSGGISASSDTVFNDQPGAGMPPGGRPTISPGGSTAGTVAPQADNVIPRAGAADTFPANTGDISPIQPGLVQPGADPQRPIDPDLDSIPALW